MAVKGMIELEKFKEKLMKYCKNKYEFHEEMMEIEQEIGFKQGVRWHKAKRDSYHGLYSKLESGHFE